MKALVKVKKGIGHLEYIDVPEPKPGYGEVKIKVKACGICGTDIHIWKDEFPYFPPIVLGHELSGVIEELGDGVTGLTIGQKVVSEAVYQVCGKCEACRTGYYNLCLTRKGLGWAKNGAFATFTIVEAKNIHQMPNNLSFEEAALSEPLAVSAYAVSELTKVKAGDIVLISGPGPIGILVMQCALAEGAFVIVSGTESDKLRLNVAKELGAQEIVNIDRDDLLRTIQKYNKLGADIVFECSGAASAVRSGIDVIKKGGKFTQVGLFGKPIQINMDQIVTKELIVTGVFSSNWRGWHQGLRLVAQDRINLKPLISHVLPVSEWKTAFSLIENKQSLKIVLLPEDDMRK